MDRVERLDAGRVAWLRDRLGRVGLDASLDAVCIFEVERVVRLAMELVVVGSRSSTSSSSSSSPLSINIGSSFVAFVGEMNC